MKRLRKIKLFYFVILVLIIIAYIFFSSILPTFTRYYYQITANAVGYGVTKHSITYELNGGTQAEGQVTSFCSNEMPVTLLEPIKSGYAFRGWYTDSGFSGSPIDTITSAQDYTLYAKWVQGVAEMNGTVYNSLKTAVENAPENVETTIKLLCNRSEIITTGSLQNIVLNLQNYTLSNSGSNNVIKNYGTLKISNGTINTTVTQGAINNHGTLIITGGNITATGTVRQAIYNDGGNLTISGTANLSSESTNRATVHNLNSGTLTITGGTIVSSGFSAVLNAETASTMVIGTKDDNPNKDSLTIQGKSYGVDSKLNFEFYDGTIKGKTNSISDQSKVPSAKRETGYNIAYSEEVIDTVTYKTAYLAITSEVRFNANGGTVDESTRNIETGQKIGTLPKPTKTGFSFLGWFTLSEGGDKIDSNTIINGNVEYFAHWKSSNIAKIGSTNYSSMQSAIDAVTADNTETTITLLGNINENFSIPVNKNVVLDLQSYEIRNNTTGAIITNKGTLKITNGKITQYSAFAAIDNSDSGKIIITGGRIESNGGKACIFATGTAQISISDSAYLTSNASGEVDMSGTLRERGTVQTTGINNTITITGGTIIGTQGLAVSNVGILTIGTKSDGQVSNTSPVIMGKTYGIKSTRAFDFYDGVIKGITGAISGTISDKEPNTHEVDDTETIETDTYYIKYLEEDT